MALKDAVEALILGRSFQTKVGRSNMGKLGVIMLWIWRNKRKCLEIKTSTEWPSDIKAHLKSLGSVGKSKGHALELILSKVTCFWRDKHNFKKFWDISKYWRHFSLTTKNKRETSPAPLIATTWCTDSIAGHWNLTLIDTDITLTIQYPNIAKGTTDPKVEFILPK